ncbi:hypothetical protein E2C01_073239 [Portunus trituberculatus]|uniref:Uncharacterized protein n=1 Tax=Portunus trituberculatus TaxID=210409 RepID=A0A5B7I4N8_PORTR|nr:hypothetical protein [Portunus trituberculatus]
MDTPCGPMRKRVKYRGGAGHGGGVDCCKGGSDGHCSHNTPPRHHTTALYTTTAIHSAPPRR